MTSSTSFSQLGLLACLAAAEKFLSLDRSKWVHQTELQGALLNELSVQRDGLLDAEGLRTWASHGAAELNQILASEGFEISVPDFSYPGFGAVSILKRTLEWTTPGHRGLLEVRGQQVPAFGLTSGFRVSNVGRTSQVVVELKTRSGDEVFIIPMSEEIHKLDLTDRARELLEKNRYCLPYDEVQVPMVDFEEAMDLTYLVEGMWNHIEDDLFAELKMAFQQNKFRMNEEGARVESATSVVGALACASAKTKYNIYEVDQPFLFVLRSKGGIQFVAHVYPDVMKDPEKRDHRNWSGLNRSDNLISSNGSYRICNTWDGFFIWRDSPRVPSILDKRVHLTIHCPEGDRTWTVQADSNVVHVEGKETVQELLPQYPWSITVLE